MKPKVWQILVLVAGVGAVIFLGWRLVFGGPQISLITTYDLIDVETGEIFHVADLKLVLPAKNPETGKYSLLPVSKDETGKWRVASTDLGQLGGISKDVQVKAIDRQSGEVTVEVGPSKQYTLPSAAEHTNE